MAKSSTCLQRTEPSRNRKRAEQVADTVGKDSRKMEKTSPSLHGRTTYRNPRSRVTWDRCYDFKNIFAEKFSEKIYVFDSK
jgi:hypothetical protein